MTTGSNFEIKPKSIGNIQKMYGVIKHASGNPTKKIAPLTSKTETSKRNEDIQM